LVPYSAAQMFELVDDIESYEQFLPWCKSSKVDKRTEEEVEATLEVAYGKMHKAFTTRNHLLKYERITMKAIAGPFKHLLGVWHFESLGEDGCKVSLELDFEFANRIMGMTLGPVFHHLANTLVDAFYKRAVQVYGE
jgi:ribosome-associated toxin RatA of RatAB toxin-antitoxin module